MKLTQGLRQHFKVDGQPKAPLTREEAYRRAAQQHKLPYLCPICNRWHIGGSK